MSAQLEVLDSLHGRSLVFVLEIAYLFLLEWLLLLLAKDRVGWVYMGVFFAFPIVIRVILLLILLISKWSCSLLFRFALTR